MPSYPYISGQGALTQAFTQLRKGFPAKVDAGYLQRFKIAPANESYVISILKFLSLIDENGDRVEANTAYFYGDDGSFQAGLEATIRQAYIQLFDEMGAEAFEADRGSLTHWFRAADKTSDLVGQRQASTFLTLSALAGHGELPAARNNNTKKAGTAPRPAKKPSASKKAAAQPRSAASSITTGAAAATGDGAGIGAGQADSKGIPDVGLTVRIEVNLPPGGDADTYDAIFASIKKHLMS